MTNPTARELGEQAKWLLAEVIDEFYVATLRDHQITAAIDRLVELAEAAQVDAGRWRGVKARHAMSLVRLATGSSAYNSAKAGPLLDSWADMARTEVEAFDADAWREELPGRIADLEANMKGAQP